jgi:hypothetical protein
VTEQLLVQQLESPSGTGRDEPRSQISLPATPNNKRDTNSQNPFSLAAMHYREVRILATSLGRDT